MSQSKPLRNDQENCFICFTEITHPRPLPGTHTCINQFCLKCLKEYSSESVVNEADEDKNPCPVCNKLFTVSDEAMKMIWDNDSMTNVLLSERSRKRKAEPSKCDLCENVNAESFCIECKQGLCHQCKQFHSKMSATKLHKVVDVAEKPNDDKLKRMKSYQCVKHDDKEIVLYCCDCNEMLCNTCHAADHGNHKCMSSTEAFKAANGSVVKYQELIEKYCENERKKAKDLHDSKAKYNKQIFEIEVTTKELFVDLAKLLEERKTVVMKRLRHFRNQHAENTASRLNKCRSNMAELNRFLSDCRTIIEDGTFSDLRSTDEIQKRAKRLIKLQNQYENEDHTDVNVRLLNSPDQIKKEVKQVLIGVNVDDSSKMTGCCRRGDSNLPVRKVSHDLMSLGSGANVRGLTVVDDVLYQLVDDDKSQVYAFDKETFALEPTINIPEMIFPRDLVGCDQNKVLYISDQELNCIHKVDLGSNTVMKSEMNENEEIQGLSLTPKNYLLVTVWEKNTEGRSKVIELFSDLSSNLDIEFDATIRYAQQTVETCNDHYVTLYDSGSASGIALINWMGNVVERFDIPQNAASEELRSLAIDHNTCCVFLADHTRNAVVMFSRDLIRLGMVPMSDFTASPCRIFFDCSSDRLYMSENGSKNCLSIINPQEFTTRNNGLGLHVHSKDI